MNNPAWEKAQTWAQNPYFNPSSRKEIEELLLKKDYSEITERFYRDLEFGTGGLRGLIGMGSNRINIYTVRKATQALATTLRKTFPTANHKVTISYDSRNFSREFAEEVASVIAGNGMEALIYSRLNPVPLLSFSVLHQKAHAGVMITASHNPRAYNGYKVFWAHGGQVTPPIDKQIIEAYNQLEDFSTIRYLEFTKGLENGLIKWMGEEIEEAYHQALYSRSFNPQLCRQRGRELKMAYTPLHGTGKIPCTEALTRLGLTNYHLVPEQAEPNGQFPTLTTPPNPEIPEALTQVVKLMKSIEADVAYGTDPDTDRLGVVVRHKEEIHYLNGNQMTALLLHYILTQLRDQNRLKKNAVAIKTIVTTELFTTIAKSFGVKVENTLTGFKWMCGRFEEMHKADPTLQFVFASEESYGHLTHDLVRDKDAVAALACTSEMALWYKTQNLTLIDALDKIYDQYGFFYEELLSLDYEGKEGVDKIERIMNSFRQNPPQSICQEDLVLIEDYQLQRKRDLTTGESSSLTLPKSNAIGLHLKSGNIIYLRPSGTEPKIKFYIMIQEREGDLPSKKKRAFEKAKNFQQFLREKAEGC